MSDNNEIQSKINANIAEKRKLLISVIWSLYIASCRIFRIFIT